VKLKTQATMADDDAPSWLTEDDSGNAPVASPPSPATDDPRSFSMNEGGNTTTAAPSATGTDSSATGSAGGGGGGTSRGSRARSSTAPAVSEQDEKDLPGIILMMRLANMAVSVVLITCSVITMMTFPSPATWVLAIYASCGGLLICCLETQLKFLRVIIAMNFGFLFSSIWRFVFYLILGTVCWAYKNLFGRIVGLCIVVVALFNAFVICRYPSYRKMREKIAEEEDKRIEARISKEVRKQAVKSAFGSN